MMKKIMKSIWFSFFLFFIGIVATVILIKTGPSPLKTPILEQEQVVSAIKVSPINVIPWIIGYGEAQPARTWKAVSQVGGKISWKSPKLKNGEFFEAGELLLSIDDSEIKLKILSAEATIKKIQAKMEELTTTKTNMMSQLAILKSILEFQEKEFKRQQSLLTSKSVSVVTVENQEIAVLQQRNTIDGLESNLRLLPSQISYQEAELAIAQAELAQRKLELNYAKIYAPFDCRVDSASVEEQQYVSIGQNMVTVDSIDEMEIFLQFRMEQIGLLFAQPPNNGNGIEKISEEKRKATPPNWKISVNISGLANSYSWPGQFRRIASGIDTTTRMISMIVGVQEPYRRNNKILGPPLAKGSFCTVKIEGKEQENLLVLPRYAIHDDKIYIANKDSRLEIVPIKINYHLGQYAIVGKGLNIGDLVILNDLVPAVSGMKLQLVMDENFYQQANTELSGKEVVK